MMETKYNFVKQQIKSKILEGIVLPHGKIGSENELMKEYNVSRHTVRKAIDELVNEGWVYRKQGAGTFCADRTDQKNPIGKAQRKNIALITTYLSEYIFPSIIRGAESILSEHGYQVTIFSTNNNHEQEKRALEAVLSQRFDGLIVEPTKSSIPNPNINYYLNLERQGIPYVMINAYYEELEPYFLGMDDVKGGYTQTKHLLDLGHEQIVGLFKNDDLQGAKRLKGFIKAHRERGIALNPQHIITYTTEQKNAKPLEELHRIFKDRSHRPTGIVCYNDELALKLLDVIREFDIRVPEELSVVGYDDSFLSVASEVKLTTIQHPKVEMGIDAAKLIISCIEQERKDRSADGEQSIIYEPKLVVRHSTAEAKSEKGVAK